MATPLKENVRADLYRRAADYLEERYADASVWGACWAIMHGADGTHADLGAFKDAFSPDLGFGSYWWGFSHDEHSARILALHFMAEMVETGDA